MRTHEGWLARLDIALPEVDPTAGSYVGAVRAGHLVFVSGQGPIRGGKVLYAGKVGAEVSQEYAQEAARLAGLHMFAVLRAEIGSLDRVKRVVKILGWVNDAPAFHRRPEVIDGVSDLLVEVFGDRGRDARSAVSSTPLVFDMAVEDEMVVEIHP